MADGRQFLIKFLADAEPAIKECRRLSEELNKTGGATRDASDAASSHIPALEGTGAAAKEASKAYSELSSNSLSMSGNFRGVNDSFGGLARGGLEVARSLFGVSMIFRAIQQKSPLRALVGLALVFVRLDRILRIFGVKSKKASALQKLQNKLSKFGTKGIKDAIKEKRKEIKLLDMTIKKESVMIGGKRVILSFEGQAALESKRRQQDQLKSLKNQKRVMEFEESWTKKSLGWLKEKMGAEKLLQSVQKKGGSLKKWGMKKLGLIQSKEGIMPKKSPKGPLEKMGPSLFKMGKGFMGILRTIGPMLAKFAIFAVVLGPILILLQALSPLIDAVSMIFEIFSSVLEMIVQVAVMPFIIMFTEVAKVVMELMQPIIALTASLMPLMVVLGQYLIKPIRMFADLIKPFLMSLVNAGGGVSAFGSVISGISDFFITFSDVLGEVVVVLMETLKEMMPDIIQYIKIMGKVMFAVGLVIIGLIKITTWFFPLIQLGLKITIKIWNALFGVINYVVGALKLLGAVVSFVYHLFTDWSKLKDDLGAMGDALGMMWSGIKAILTPITILWDVLIWILDTIIKIKDSLFGSSFLHIAEGVKQVSGPLDWLLSTFKWVGEIAGFIASPLKALWGIGKAVFSGIASVATMAWDGIKSAASAAWSGVKSVASTAWEGVKSVWGGVKGYFSGIWSGVGSVVSTAWEGIKASASTAWSAVKNSASTYLSGVKDITASVWSGIKGVFSAGANAVANKDAAMWERVMGVATASWKGYTGVIKTGVKVAADVAKANFTGLKNVASQNFQTMGKIAVSELNAIKTVAGETTAGFSGSGFFGIPEGVRSVLGPLAKLAVAFNPIIAYLTIIASLFSTVFGTSFAIPKTPGVTPGGSVSPSAINGSPIAGMASARKLPSVGSNKTELPTEKSAEKNGTNGSGKVQPIVIPVTLEMDGAIIARAMAEHNINIGSERRGEAPKPIGHESVT